MTRRVEYSPARTARAREFRDSFDLPAWLAKAELPKTGEFEDVYRR